MTQQLFEDMIGSPPPSTVDVEAIVATQRRKLRRRRTAATGAVAAAVAGLLVGIGAVAADKTTPPAPGGPPSSRSAPRGEDTASTERRLSEALRQAVRREAPAAQLSTLEGGGPPLGDPFAVTYRECGRSNPPRRHPMNYFGAGGVRVGEHAGILNVELGYDVRDLYCEAGFARMEPKWTESVGPRGQAVLTSRDPDSLRIRILVVQPNGTYVAVLHMPRWPTLESASLSLTVDQVRKIALDPALEL